MGVRLATPHDREARERFYASRASARRSGIYVERTPDVFQSFRTEGAETDLVLAEDSSTRRVTGAGAASYRRAYLNGGPEPIQCGYLGSLEIEPGQWRLLRAGYAELSARARTRRCPVHLTSVLSANAHARKVLPSRRLGIPEYRWEGGLTTMICSPRALRKLGRGEVSDEVSARVATRADYGDIDRFITEVGPLWQAFPAYTCEDLTGRGFLPDACPQKLLVVRDQRQVRAIGLVWDIERMKRWRINLGGMNPLAKLLRRLGLKLQALPDILSTTARCSFLAARLVRADDPQALRRLLVEAGKLMPAGASLCLTFHERDPLAKVLERIAAIRLSSELFSVHFDQVTFDFDGRPFYVEAGAL